MDIDTQRKHRQFAMTLHYYSPKVYDYVRKLITLPHVSSLRAWASTVGCEPGYLVNVMKEVGRVLEEKKLAKDVAQVVDAVTLHRGVILACEKSELHWKS